MKELSTPSNLSAEQIKAFGRADKMRRLYYYRPEHAESTRLLLDKLHSTSNPIRVQAKDLSTATLRLQYYQGAKYLVENDDTEDHHYAKLYTATKCVTFENYLEFHIRQRSSLRETQEVIPWKEQFVNFIETAKPKDKILLERLALTTDDISWAEAQLAPLVKVVENTEIPLFFGEIKNDRILIIRDEN